MKNNVVDLSPVSNNVLTGRNRGELARSHFNIHEYDQWTDEKVSVIIPDRIISMGSSFFLGMFDDSLTHAGSKSVFFERFNFKCTDHIRIQINKHVARVLRN